MLSYPQYKYLMSIVERFKHSGDQSPYKLIRAFRYFKYLLLSVIANWLIKRIKISKRTSAGDAQYKITASLTTFPARINQVRYAIISILNQTVRPDKVVLWLAREQFPEGEIPHNLVDLCEHGLEIRFCDDLRSHKKYYYALQEQKPDEVVITFDDDIIYHPHTIERLLKKHEEYPKSIICSQVHVMTYDEKGSIKPYREWSNFNNTLRNPNKDFMPLTGSGCLYPYHVMPEITFDKIKIKEIAFTADDLWIGYLAKIWEVPISVVDKPANVFSVVAFSQTQHLGQINCLEDGNDKAMEKLVKEITNRKS